MKCLPSRREGLSLTSPRSTIRKAPPTRRTKVPDGKRWGGKKARGCPAAAGLLDLGFLELDVLTRDGVILLEAQLLSLGPRILLRHVEEARVGTADELDFDGCRL